LTAAAAALYVSHVYIHVWHSEFSDTDIMF